MRNHYIFYRRKLKNPKDIAANAAKRMVKNDDDVWRKRTESYGFLLAKSMIMMNAELLRDRMRPENIARDIGRDHWDYSNDRVIGTGKGWNYNVMDGQLFRPRVHSTGRFNQEADDSLMRASGPAYIGTSANRTAASREEIQEQSLEDANVRNFNDYANPEVLEKELQLGKGLLLRACNSIDNDYLKSLKEHQNATEYEVKT